MEPAGDSHAYKYKLSHDHTNSHNHTQSYDHTHIYQDTHPNEDTHRDKNQTETHLHMATGVKGVYGA